eukprot:3087261-Amphidinium_carterae.1
MDLPLKAAERCDLPLLVRSFFYSRRYLWERQERAPHSGNSLLVDVDHSPTHKFECSREVFVHEGRNCVTSQTPSRDGRDRANVFEPGFA